MPIIETRNLCKRYGTVMRVTNLALQVPEGSIYGFLGPNGAGKSTTLKMILGLVRPTQGEIQVFGQPMNRGNRIAVLRQVGSLIESPSYYGHLTGEENLRIVQTLRGLPPKAIREVLEIVRLEGQRGKKVCHYSLGMKQRLGIAIALCGDPDFLVLDEPINGLDPQGIVEMRELILKLNRERQITVLISSHILDELSKLATHYGFIDGGRMVKEVSAQELEAACRKCARVEVTSVPALCRVLDGWQLEYSVVDGAAADIYGELNITALVDALRKEGCSLLSMKERDESLESYYINLVGGERHG